jgi:hypothetical protein
MFDLDQAVHGYCSSVSTSWFRRSAQIAELEDHLYCEIEQLVIGGASPERAFAQATSKLGETADLQREFGKNRRRFSSVSNFRRFVIARFVSIRFERPRLAMTAFLLFAVVPAVILFQRGTVARWTLNVFEACCAASVKVIGMFG